MSYYYVRKAWCEDDIFLELAAGGKPVAMIPDVITQCLRGLECNLLVNTASCFGDFGSRGIGNLRRS